MNVFAPLLRVLRRRLRTEERGFTIVELMVAQGIILVSLLSLAYTATVGFSDIALARQRQGANGLANRLIEQVRSLPFATLKTGMSTTDSTIAGDLSIVNSGCGGGNKCYKPTASSTLEAIPMGNNPVQEPLNPHFAAVTIGVTAYTRYVYVTKYKDSTGTEVPDAFRVTTVVKWAPPQRGAGLATVQASTVAFSPQGGCITGANHPFAAPCQPFIYGNAQAPAGTITVTPTLNSGFAGVQGLDLEKGIISTVGQQVTGQVEQITSMTARALTSGGDMKWTGQTNIQQGKQPLATAADNDPAQAGGTDDPASGAFPSTLAGSLAANQTHADDDEIGILLGNGDAIASGSTMTANGTRSCGANASLPCGRTSATQAATNSVKLVVTQGQVNLEPALPAVISPFSPSTASTALVQRKAPSGLDGSMDAQLTRNMATVILGGLPTNFAGPAGWNTQNAFVRLAGYSTTLEAEAGTSSVAMPLSAAVTGGSAVVIQYWNGTGYTNITADQLNTATPVSFTPVTLDRTLTFGSQTARIVITGTFQAGGVSTTSVPAGATTNRTSAVAQALPALIGTMTYQITTINDSTPIQADLTFAINMGTQIASASYTPAPGGA
jgi:type II secretory pathway pseudopilin PulG